MTLKLTDALRMRDLELEMTMSGELSNVVPDEHLAATRTIVRKAIAKASESWVTKTLDDVFGRARADKIRSRLNRISLD